VGLATFVLIWLAESAVGSMPIPPVKEISASILVAGGLMQFVSPETPLWSVLRTAWAEVTAPRLSRSRAVLVPVRPRVVTR
jgi:hypothetical protein